MNRDEEKQRLIEDRNELEMELDGIEEQIRLGYVDEDDEWDYMNSLQNEIMGIESALRDFE